MSETSNQEYVTSWYDCDVVLNVHSIPARETLLLGTISWIKNTQGKACYFYTHPIVYGRSLCNQ